MRGLWSGEKKRVTVKVEHYLAPTKTKTVMSYVRAMKNFRKYKAAAALVSQGLERFRNCLEVSQDFSMQGP